MKKILILIMAMLMMVGCSTDSKKETTFMITRDHTLYALYNQDGERLTEYSYKTFEEVEGVGYIVTDDKDQKGFISLKGDYIIETGTYETIEAVDKMLYATKKEEVKQDDKKDEDKKTEVNATSFLKKNVYVLNGEGEVLYAADENTGIMKSGLPIILKDQQYIVLYEDGKELYKGHDEVKYATHYKDGTCEVIGFNEFEKFYYFSQSEDMKDIELTIKEKGTFKILAQNELGAVLNDEVLKSMVYVDFSTGKYYQNNIAVQEVTIDESKNVVLKSNGKTFVYPVGKAPILMSSYYMSATTYAARSTVVYGPHHIYKNGTATGDLENCQLYPDAELIYSEIFPVYVRNEGYQFYNFDNKKVIDQTYLLAEPFDGNMRAIVKTSEDGYSLIDETGKVLTQEYYTQIKYIGSSYYAVYNESGMYGILDKDGSEVFKIEYTTLPDQSVVTYNNITYMILGKNGRTYVYDIENEMEVIFSNESQVVLDEKGYFIAGDQYYTFEGELIE